MRILHTADWHLGKKLEGRLRLEEQSLALDQIISVAKERNIDVIIVAGDVFDTAVPSAEAEELFFSAAARMSELAPIVVIAGNHDDADRLAAPLTLAKRHGIYLVGGMDNTSFLSDSVCGGEGWLKMNIGGEGLNLAVLPFPSKSRLGAYGEGEDYPSFVSSLIDKCTSCFGNGVNVFAAHLFMDGCLTGEAASMALMRSILPQADYCALGHIHKPQCVSHKCNAYYSGSLLKYHFDETDVKQVNIFDSSDKSVTPVVLTASRPLVRIETDNFDEALKRLNSAGDCYAELIFTTQQPLKPSQLEQLRSIPCFTKLSIINTSVKREVFTRKEQTDKEIFVSYYTSCTGKEPTEETVKAFLEVLGQ